MAKILPIITLLCLALAGCGGETKNDWAVSAGGSADGDVLVAAGKVLPGRAEVGLTGVMFNAVEENHYTPAVGPYMIYLPTIPEEVQDEWQPFVGGSLLVETEEWGFIPKGVAGVVYKPQDTISPVYMYERAWASGDIDSPDIAGRAESYHWFLLRYRHD